MGGAIGDDQGGPGWCRGEADNVENWLKKKRRTKKGSFKFVDQIWWLSH